MNDACDQGRTVEIESKLVVYCCLFVKKKSRENKDMKMIARMETEVKCLVCGSKGKLGLHYGAVTCYKCRAFFRYNKFSCVYINWSSLPACLLRKSNFSHYSCRRVPERKTNPVCKKGGKCLVDTSVEIFCTGCRLQKCLG